MPPITNFQLPVVSHKRSGVTPMDGSEVIVITTGMTVPIKLLIVMCIETDLSSAFGVYKTQEMPGRTAWGDNGVVPAGRLFYMDAIAFVNGGLDFDVRNDDLGFAAYDTADLHWLALA